MEEFFRIKSYTKRDLAMMYAIHKDIKEESAVAAFRREMKRCKELMAELYETGYHDKDRSFSRRQVELIVKYLCEP